MDICEVILSDHHDQRRMFAQLDDVPQDDVETLGAIWGRLAILLEVHAQAEEELFYPRLLELGHSLHPKQDATETDQAEETDDAIGDHNDIRDGILLAGRSEVGSADWWQGVNAAREANDEHMGEEEHEGLKDFRAHVDLQTRHEIAVAFLRFESQHASRGVPVVDKDPHDYVEEHAPTD